jgi:hypothetical protein
MSHRAVWLTLEPYTIASGLLTPTLENKRAAISRQFAAEIEGTMRSGRARDREPQRWRNGAAALETPFVTASRSTTCAKMLQLPSRNVASYSPTVIDAPRDRNDVIKLTPPRVALWYKSGNWSAAWLR